MNLKEQVTNFLTKDMQGKPTSQREIIDYMHSTQKATPKQVIGILHGCQSFKMEEPNFWRSRKEEEIDVERFLAKPPKKIVLSKRRYN